MFPSPRRARVKFLYPAVLMLISTVPSRIAKDVSPYSPSRHTTVPVGNRRRLDFSTKPSKSSVESCAKRCIRDTFSFTDSTSVVLALSIFVLGTNLIYLPQNISTHFCSLPFYQFTYNIATKRIK